MKTLDYKDSVLSNTWCERDWHYYWYCMYQNAVLGIMPTSPNIIIHYNQIPIDLIIEFSNKKVSESSLK